MSAVTLQTDTFDSPIGPMVLVSRDGRLCAVEFDSVPDTLAGRLHDRFGEVDLVPTPDANGFTSCLRAYFGGDWAALDGIPVETGGTEFQQSVWRVLRTIPPGETRSYGEIAAMLAKPGASRAVGLANAQNPVAVVIPCHRVIGANGSLTGYGGGVHRKQWLLRHEAAQTTLF